MTDKNTPQKKTYSTGVRLNKPLLDSVDRIAAEEQRTRSSMLAILIEEAVARRQTQTDS